MTWHNFIDFRPARADMKIIIVAKMCQFEGVVYPQDRNKCKIFLSTDDEPWELILFKYHLSIPDAWWSLIPGC